MTREEYQAKLAKLHGQFDCDLVARLKAYYISSLETENAKLKDALEKAAKCLYERTQSCPSDMFDWDHPETCDIECNTHSHVDDAWKCWLDWLMGHE